MRAENKKKYKGWALLYSPDNDAEQVVVFCLRFWHPQRFANHRRCPNRKDETNNVHISVPAWPPQERDLTQRNTLGVGRPSHPLPVRQHANEEERGWDGKPLEIV